MNALEAFQQALTEGADDDALDVAAADVRRDSGPAALVEAIKMRIAHELARGKTPLDVTALRFRLAGALEEVAKTSLNADGASAAIEAAALCRDVLNDGEAATRNLVHALRAGANDDAMLKKAVAEAGGAENASSIIERALKRPDVKADNATTASLRRALSRVAEGSGDKERAFFEMLKAARKAPSDGQSVDDVFRLALETGRNTEAAAFFGALAEDASIAPRQRATVLNKLGQTLERTGDKRAAFEAYTKSLNLHEAKAVKRNVERLADELGVEPQHAKITVDAKPEVTPPYDHVLGRTVPEEDALRSKSPPRPPPPPPTEQEVGDDAVISAEERLSAMVPRQQSPAPADVTMPRVDLTLRTAELPDVMPTVPATGGANGVAPPPPPPLPPTSDEGAAVEVRAPSQPASAPRPPEVVAAMERVRSPRAVVAGMNHLDASESTGSMQSPSPISVPPVAKLPSLDDQPVALQTPPGVRGEGHRQQIAPPPSVEKTDPTALPVKARGPKPKIEGAPPVQNNDDPVELPVEMRSPAGSEEMFPPATTPFPLDDGASRAKAPAPPAPEHADKLAPAKLEAALAQLPDRERSPDNDDKTRRVPHAAAMKTLINTLDGTVPTNEGLPSDKRPPSSSSSSSSSSLSKGKGRSKGKSKKDKSAQKKPVAPGQSKVLVDPSREDPPLVSAPTPAPLASASEPGPEPMPAPSSRGQDVFAKSSQPEVPARSKASASVAPDAPDARGRLRVPLAPPSPLPSPSARSDGATNANVNANANDELNANENVEVGAPLGKDDDAVAAARSGKEARDAAATLDARPRPTRKPHPDEATVRSPAPSAVAAHAASEQHPATAEEPLPPLHVPPMSVPSMEASSTLTRALAALENGALDECVTCAMELDVEAPADPRVLRLAARALLLGATAVASGEAKTLDANARRIFVEHCPKLGDRAAALALEIRDQLPDEERGKYGDVWLAGAMAAGLDATRVLELVRDAAVEDAPHGPAFKHAERVLIQTGDARARDALYQGAIDRLVARSDDETRAAETKARAELVQLRIALLESISKPKEALPLYAQLVTELASHDLVARKNARRAFTEHGTPDERARFLAKLARRLPGAEGIDVVQELLEVRLSVDDKLGAEAAVKDLIARRPGDSKAITALANLLDAESGREQELVEVLRTGATQAMTVTGKTGEARTFLERLAAVQSRIGKLDEAADALLQIARLVPEEVHIDKALHALDELKRHKDAVALLEEAAGQVADATFRARTLLRASDIARVKLQKRGKARELVERALEASPKDRHGLRALADLLVEIGDVQAAVSGLERLAAEERDPKEKAKTHLRIGRLLEEHLLRPDDALKRYRAAADLDASSKDVWSAIRAVARQRGESALLVEALRGLAGADGDAKEKEKASLWRQIAKVEREERADIVAAEAALRQALAHDAGDVEALQQLLALLAARLMPDVDIDTALAQPDDVLLEGVRGPIVAAGANAGTNDLPLPLRRLHALALSRGGDRAEATAAFEQLLVEHPDDLETLMAFARHLAAAAATTGSAQGVQGVEARRLRVLETILFHHAYSLKPRVHVDVWGDVTALRAATGDGGGARKAAKKVMALATTEELKASLSDRAVRAVALALDDSRDSERDPKAVVAALRLDAERTLVDSEKAKQLERAAQVCREEMKDLVAARVLLEQALRVNPQSFTARDQMVDLDLAVGDVAGALKQVRDALAKESEPSKKAVLHLRMFRLRKRLDLDVEGAAVELKTALELDPTNEELLNTAEQFFNERKDADGLDKLWSAQLRAIDRNDHRARLKLLERLAQLRRYERRDFTAAIEALEAMTALDPEALKPREDAARLYTELGLQREAVGAWRGVLERDPLSAEAWRGVLGRFVATRQGDEAFAVASTMLALDVADHDIGRIVRTIRPPFPRWPIPPKDPQLFRKKVAHPLERTAVRAVLDAVGPRVLPLYARDLRSFGLRRKDALLDKNVPTSVLLAVRTLAQLLGLPAAPPMFAGELGDGDTTAAANQAAPPPFAVLPSLEPGIIVTREVLKGGMTPERAFALGRAASWLQPHAVMAAAVDAATLRLVLEGLVAAFLGPKSLERPDLDAEKLGKELAHALLKNRTNAEETALKSELLPALRDYVHARPQVQVADWRAGVGYSGDRVGFLMSTDLNAAFRMIKASSGGGQSIGARLAIKELVLFSVSSSYLSLRKDLGLALPELAAAPLLDVS